MLIDRPLPLCAGTAYRCSKILEERMRWLNTILQKPRLLVGGQKHGTNQPGIPFPSPLNDLKWRRTYHSGYAILLTDFAVATLICKDVRRTEIPVQGGANN